MFRIIFAAETAKGLVIGLEWWGAEGVHSFFLNQTGDTFKEMDVGYSRYTSPLYVSAIGGSLQPWGIVQRLGLQRW